MEAVAGLLAERNIATLRFEFGYMAARRQGGSRKPPPKAERLMDEYRAAVAGAPKGAPLLIGGKSMGGRVASLVADELYDPGAHRRSRLPRLPVSSAQEARSAAHGASCGLEMPQRSSFRAIAIRSAPAAKSKAMTLSAAIRFHWAGDGDHDLGPRGNSGFTRKGNLAAAADAIAAFAAELVAADRLKRR